MAKQYKQTVNNAQTRFTAAPMGEIEFSKMTATPTHLTCFNAGDFVPIYCAEVLPGDTFKIDLDFVIRQATCLVPSMGQMEVDVLAYWVPNRVVNSSWKQVMGENLSGSWSAPEISLAPLYAGVPGSIKVPVGSVADFYGFPTQQHISTIMLNQCHDLKFRGYLEIWNNYIRDQNYQPPIPYSKLNVYEGFFQEVGSEVSLDPYFNYPNPNGNIDATGSDLVSDGSIGVGAITRALYGDGFVGNEDSNNGFDVYPRLTSWSALDTPLKANKFHDYFTSVLPSPQKAAPVLVGTGLAPVMPHSEAHFVGNASSGNIPSLKFASKLGYDISTPFTLVASNGDVSGTLGVSGADVGGIVPSNLYAEVGFTLDDLRMSAAIQQVYEVLARGGSRYREFINSFFGLDVDNPFDDIPTCIGHIRRKLDLYQTAQTSATNEDGSGTAQGNLTAFGYTNSGGGLFTKTFVEHGYVHIFAIVRHRSIYASGISRDNFRMNMLDFYSYPLANISEQPVYTREINAFANDITSVFGYQEAWAEYRMEPDRVSGLMRPGVPGSLAFWNYADEFDSGLQICDGDWLKSNSAAVLNRSTALSDKEAPQFKAQFMFKIEKQRPMPTYSVAGLDII